MRFSRSVLLRKNTGLSGSGIACGTMPGVQTRGILSTVLVSRWQLPSSRVKPSQTQVTGPMCPGMLQVELHHTSTLLLLGGGLLGGAKLADKLAQRVYVVLRNGPAVECDTAGLRSKCRREGANSELQGRGCKAARVI